MPPRIRLRPPPRRTPQCTRTQRARPFHTNLTSASSPAIESHWLAQNSRHKGGAMLAAKMSPRAQLVAAEEGLLGSWFKGGNVKDKNKHPAEEAKMQIQRRTAAASMAVTPLRTRWDTKGKATERDDTPGLVAFSAVLLLPLAFQLGRYFEGRESHGWPSETVFARVLSPDVGGWGKDVVEGGGGEAEAEAARSREWKWSSLLWAGGEE